MQQGLLQHSLSSELGVLVLMTSFVQLGVASEQSGKQRSEGSYPSKLVTM